MLFTILLKLPPYRFKANGPDSSLLEGVFNRMNYERLLPYSREIAKEVLHVVFRFIGANRVHNIDLLIVFLLPKNTYIV